LTILFQISEIIFLKPRISRKTIFLRRPLSICD
jgi:hypothetical protein